jgi:hypothetical protein
MCVWGESGVYKGNGIRGSWDDDWNIIFFEKMANMPHQMLCGIEIEIFRKRFEWLTLSNVVPRLFWLNCLHINFIERKFNFIYTFIHFICLILDGLYNIWIKILFINLIRKKPTFFIVNIWRYLIKLR